MQERPRYSCPWGRCPPGSATGERQESLRRGAQQDPPARGRGLLTLPPADYPAPPPALRSFEAEGSPSGSQVVSLHRRLIYVIPLHAPVSQSPAPNHFPCAPEMTAQRCTGSPAGGWLGGSSPAPTTTPRPSEPCLLGHRRVSPRRGNAHGARGRWPVSTATRVLPSADAGIGFRLD